jgi:hypothetical protein
VIGQANSIVSINCPPSVVFDGTLQTPCTATATGAALNQSLTVTYLHNQNVGTVTASASFAGDANHTGSDNSTTFDITPAQVTVTAGSYAGVYDGVFQAPSACVVSGAYIGILSCSNSPLTVGPAAGSGIVVPVPGGDTLFNFDITSVNGTWVITPAALTITAENQSMSFGASAPTFTASYSPFVGGDSTAVVSGLTFTVYTDSGKTIPVTDFTTLKAGTYPIVASGAIAASYQIAFTDGVLTVNKAAVTGSVTITPADPATVSYGQPATATVYLNS